MTTKEFIENKNKEIKENLEETLDEYFPKIEEEGPKKIANKRGAALVLFTESVIRALQALEVEAQVRLEIVSDIEKRLGKEGTFTGSMGYQGFINGIESYQRDEDKTRDEVIAIILNVKKK